MASDWTGESNLVVLCGSDKGFPFGNSILPDKQHLNVYSDSRDTGFHYEIERNAGSSTDRLFEYKFSAFLLPKRISPLILKAIFVDETRV